MNKKVRLKGQLRLYMQWPAFMTILLIAMNFWIFSDRQESRGLDDCLCRNLCSNRGYYVLI